MNQLINIMQFSLPKYTPKLVKVRHFGNHRLLFFRDYKRQPLPCLGYFFRCKRSGKIKLEKLIFSAGTRSYIINRSLNIMKQVSSIHRFISLKEMNPRTVLENNLFTLTRHSRISSLRM